MLRERQIAYSDFREESILICSWNVSAMKPPSLMERQFWHDWIGVKANPSIIIVGLQEAVELESKAANVKMIFKKAASQQGLESGSRLQRWMERLTSVIEDVHTSRYR